MKKNRRKADEVNKNFQCPYSDCNRTYGTDVSLNLHIKIKHNGGNKTERERTARMIIKNKNNNKDNNVKNINFPPGYLEAIEQSYVFK